jgi:hypothetical protein
MIDGTWLWHSEIHGAESEELLDFLFHRHFPHNP